jgi:hypothetical protein
MSQQPQKVPVDHTERWACVGKRMTRNRRLAQFWVKLDPPSGPGYRTSGPFFSVGNVFVAGAGVGAVYEVSVTEDGQFYSKGSAAPVFQYRMPADDPLVVQWDAEDKAARAMHEQIRTAKKASETPTQLDEALAIVRNAYHGLRTHDEQAGFLAYATASITNYSTWRREQNKVPSL